VTWVLLAVLSMVLVVPGAALGASASGRPLLVTVDDLPIAVGSLHPEAADRERLTRGLLAALERHDVPAVGLVTWRNVHGPEDLELLEMWLAAGHELGNHSYGHLNYTATPAEEYIADVEAGRRELAAFLDGRGVGLRFFRFPMLREGDSEAKLEAMRAYLEASGQRNLPVTIDNQDWSYERPWVEARRAADEEAAARVAEAYHEALHVSVRHHEHQGDRLLGRAVPQILLLHANAVGAAQWDRLFSWLEKRGYRFAHVDEVLADPVFAEPHRFVGSRGFGLWDRLIHERWQAAARQEIEAVLRDQEQAWSRGDLEGFVGVYAEDAAFASPKGLTTGRGTLLERYRQAYPDRQAMGLLSLEILDYRPASGLEVSMLGDARPGQVHGASVVARWTLRALEGDEEEVDSGLTLLVFRRLGGAWRIVHDASM
jgi:peptidoglycan/xylan/chitin deacetylase (PgdA/CDA1 family)/ketosteroid isomerase-like protein